VSQYFSNTTAFYITYAYIKIYYISGLCVADLQFMPMLMNARFISTHWCLLHFFYMLRGNIYLGLHATNT